MSLSQLRDGLGIIPLVIHSADLVAGRSLVGRHREELDRLRRYIHISEQ